MELNLRDFVDRPLFIALEGIDGVGKTTQSKLLCDHLNSEGITTSITAEAKGTPIADVIRSHYLTGERKVNNMTNAYLFTADRYDRFTNEENGVFSVMKTGCSYVCDRWILSSAVYSAMHVDSGKEKAIINHMFEVNYPLLRTLYKDIKPLFAIILNLKFADEYLNEAAKRIESRAAENNKSIDIYEDNLRYQQQLFVEAKKKFVNEGHIQIIDVELSPDADVSSVENKIWSIVVKNILKASL